MPFNDPSGSDSIFIDVTTIARGSQGPQFPGVYSLSIDLVNAGLSLLITVRIITVNVTDPLNQPRSFRIYYLPVGKITNSDIISKSLYLLLSKAQYVADVPVSNSQAQILVPITNYAAGGWMFAVPLSLGSAELGTDATEIVPIPTTTIGATPANEVTNQAVVRNIFTIGAITYNKLDITMNAPTPISTFSYAEIFIGNYLNTAVTASLGAMYYAGSSVGGDAMVGHYTLECDDGTGGFPNPGAHACTIYFVANSAAGVHRPDYIAASPNVVLATGIHS